MADKLPALRESMNILQGIPSRVALPLAYLKAKSRPAAGAEMMPDRDGCGLIWFSPLLPMDASLVRDFIQEATRVCIAEGIEPMITLTAISERCFDSTIPLVFDVKSEADQEKARRCYEALIEVAQEFRVFPYRMDIESQRRVFDRRIGESASLSLTEKLLLAADPNGIFSPGRYSSTKRPRIMPSL
jgi:4-cresol dehydrogenase (hydroxylating) flavoprotein subunit